MKHKEILKSLKKQFNAHKIPISQYENQIFPQIVKVKWATEPQIHLELLKIERARLPKGKIYQDKTERASIKLGYNSQNQIIYEEQASWNSSGGYQKFIIYENDIIWSYKYSENTIDEIEYQTLEKGIPTIFASFEKGVANIVDKYQFINKRLARIDSFSSYEAFGLDPQNPTYEITYNKLGDISEIKRIDHPSEFFPKGQNLIIFKKHEYSIKALTEIFISEIVTLIMKEIQDNIINEKKYLMLYISNSFNSDNWFPPKIVMTKLKNVENFNSSIDQLIDFEIVSKNNEISITERLKESSNLLMQEIELQEKFGLPFNILLKIAKKVKSLYSENLNKENNLIILPLDFPNDNGESINSILLRVYKKSEIKKLEQN